MAFLKYRYACFLYLGIYFRASWLSALFEDTHPISLGLFTIHVVLNAH